MASPFRVFRKHQKKFLAAAAILAVVVFSLPVGVQSFLAERSSPKSSKVVVQTTKYGDLSEADLSMLMYQRRRVNSFLRQVEDAVLREKDAANQRASENDRVPVTAYAAREAQTMIGPVAEEAVVASWLLAKHAEEIGLEVSDRAINDFIAGLTENCVSSGALAQIIRDLGYPNQRTFFDQLRPELLAWRARLMVLISLEGTTPAQRWDYFCRLNREATIEAIPVAVADYVDKIPNPSDEVLLAFFDEGKDRVPDPVSPDAGFRKPHEAAVRFFKADFAKVMASIPEEEVKAFYEANKEAFAPALDSQETPPLSEEATGPSDDTGAPDGGPALTDPPTDDAGDAPTIDQPAETGGAADTPTADVPNETPAAAEDAAPEGNDPATDDAPADDTSGVFGASVFSLTAFMQSEGDETDSAAADEEPGNEAASGADDDESVAGDEPTEGTEPGDETPATDGSTVIAPDEPTPGLPVVPDVPEEPAVETPAEPAASPDGETAADGTTDEEPKPAEEPEDPLAGPVGDYIRRQLAYEKIDEIFDKLRPEMDRYASELVRYDLDVEEGIAAKKPAEPDFEAMAQKADPTEGGGLTTGRTPLMSAWQYQEEDETGIGLSLIGSITNLVPFTDSVFRANSDLFTVTESTKFASDYREESRFLFWKVEDSPERPVKFDEPGVRDRVLLAWKMAEARKLALAEAEKLAAEGRKTGLSLSSTFIERTDVISPRPFSWLTFGNVPVGSARTMPRLSPVSGIDFAGHDFMKAVFDMTRGEFGVAMNHPKTIAYAVRVGQIDPPEKVLWTEFEVEPPSSYIGAADIDRAQAIVAWRSSLEKDAGLKWVRPAVPPDPTR